MGSEATRLIGGHVIGVHHAFALARPVRQPAAQRVVRQRMRRPASHPRRQVARKALPAQRGRLVAGRRALERVKALDVDLRAGDTLSG